MANQLFGSVSNPSEWVYHYTSREAALEKILSSGKLRLGTFASLNDPRESKDWSFSLSVASDERLQTDEFLKVQELATKQVKSHCKLLCMCQDDPRVTTDGIDYIFYRGFARPRMWAQYSQNHQGVCLVFNRQLLHESIQAQLGHKGTVFSGAVEYSNMHHDDWNAFHLDHEAIEKFSLEEILERKITQHYRTYFFHKAEDWSNEIEWRWVLRGQDQMPEFFDFRQAICAVILGVNFPQVYEPLMESFAKKYGIHIARLLWRNGCPIIVPCQDATLP